MSKARRCLLRLSELGIDVLLLVCPRIEFATGSFDGSDELFAIRLCLLFGQLVLKALHAGRKLIDFVLRLEKFTGTLGRDLLVGKNLRKRFVYLLVGITLGGVEFATVLLELLFELPHDWTPPTMKTIKRV